MPMLPTLTRCSPHDCTAKLMSVFSDGCVHLAQCIISIVNIIAVNVTVQSPYASRRTTGIAMDLEDDVSHTMSNYE